MRSLTRLLWLTVLLLLAAISIASSEPASLRPPSPQKQEEQKPILVGRISHVEGQLLRYVQSENDWAAVVKDAPFGLNDALYSEEKGKAEFIMPNNTWERIDGSTQVQMIRLEEDLTEMDMASGMGRFYNKSLKGLIKITTPFGYIVAGPHTTFDLYVGDKSAEVIALKGKVDFVHPSSDAKYEVMAGSSSLLADSQQIGSGEGKVDAEWDTWNLKRNDAWAKRLGAKGESRRYLPPHLYDQAAALDENGDWEKVCYEGGYHYFWRPLNVPPDWAPFTVGKWTVWHEDNVWIPDEPFGYITHHYGNWVLVGGVWYWAPPVPPPPSVRVAIGLPLLPPPPLPFFPVPFFWCPGRVSWVFSGGFVGWVPLAPFEPFYCFHPWGPGVVVVNEIDIHREHIDIDHLHYADHAVIVHDHDFVSARNYTNVRVTNINKTEMVSNFHASPVVNDSVVKNYSSMKERHNFTDENVAMKPHQEVLTRIRQNEMTAGEAEKTNAASVREDIAKARQGKPGMGAHMEEPKFTHKMVPQGEVNKPKSETRFRERKLGREARVKPGKAESEEEQPRGEEVKPQREEHPREEQMEREQPESPREPERMEKPSHPGRRVR